MASRHFQFKMTVHCFLLLLLSLAAVLPTLATARQTRITVWSINQPVLDLTGDWIEREIRKFEAANPGIMVEHRFWENQSYKIKLKVAMFGGEGPDILFNWGGESQRIYSRAGLLYDLTRDLGRDKWGLAPGMFASHSYKGRIYGIPLFPSVEVIWYNKEIFLKHGWKTPQTWQEFLGLCERIRTAGYIPIAMGGQEPWMILYPYMYLVDRLAGSGLYPAAKARQIGFTHPDFVRAFRLLRQLARQGYLPEEVLSLNYMEATQLMIQNKAAMIFMGDWEYQRLTRQMRQDFDKWDFFPFPVLAGGKGSAQDIIGAVAGFSIKASPNSRTALKFLKFLSGKASLVESYQMTGKVVTLATPYMGENDHPQIKGIAKLLANAPALTQWWDQDLPEPVTQVLLQSLQDLLAGRCSPEEAAVAIETAYRKTSEKR
ncbi:carbohydrate ABC transporter substrate-binding protein (CUT1 family) [Hydrogenispora ethanolica]|uniref:Carbohydrate ABC transporter substrate-binding protein (CUT1 family) n=1 Tax=Hydrogenispora ethanolica TaxID=1082276 RepID=A0A4R1SBR2_HYDET|nr:extracellular solute-binding protein [Hydrogenispora ethanolica]TCL77005.1 carbohydrate ABC transporter substrate-binding protein (CUT1 family) [Hydrogenispora ethanolica]